ncbi:MAG: IPT/TIG domain-containing protein, partial [Solirubrobacteraceae bacterium]
SGESETASTSEEAAKDLATILKTALGYHEEGWLRALLVFERGFGGYALQLEEGGALTKQGETLDAFAEAHGAPVPKISSIGPDHGPVAGGTTVTIGGEGFATGASVKFGSVAGTEVSVASSDSISAKSPPGTGTVDVTVTDAGGTSAASARDRFQYTGETPVDTEAPTILGVAQDGQTLIANPGVWTGPQPISYSYQWQSCNAHGGECEDVEGETSDAYTLDSGDLEATVRVLITAENADGSAHATSSPSAEVAAGPPSELEPPSITGVARAGETLSAQAGRWGGTEAEARYQWQSCNEAGGECADVQGATSAEYHLAEGDVGATLRVRVGVSDELGAATALSAATPPVLPASLTLEATSAPVLSGQPREGETLAVSRGGWLGVEPISYAYQWQRCDAYGVQCTEIAEQHGASYTLGEHDVGSVVRAVLTATDPEGSVSRSVASSQPVAAAAAPIAEEAPLLAGTPVEGNALRATSGAWSAGTQALTYSYAWQRCNEAGAACAPIEGATKATYTAGKADVHSTLRVLVTAADAKGSASDPSAPPATVAPAAPLAVAAPSISGSSELGERLEANPGIWVGEGVLAYAYQWQRCNEAGAGCTSIEGATSSSYTPVSADVGGTLRVAATATTPAGKATATSAPTAKVGDEPRAPKNTSAPALEGYPTAGDTLAAQIGAWSGGEPVEYAFQWQRCNEAGSECADIEGATKAAYVLRETDVGHQLRVIVKASNSTGSAEATSPASEVIAAPGPPKLGGEAPSIHGATQVGQSVHVENGGWSGSRPLRFHYQWQLCDAAGESCKAIEGATATSYTIAGGDADLTLRVAATATNSLGSAAASSAAAAVAPEGQASTTPALEVAEKADPSILAPAEAAVLEEQSVRPRIANAEETLEAGETLTSSTISTETPGEFAVNTAAGELSLRQLGTPLNATSTPTIVNSAVAAYANTAAGADTFVRATPLGATTFVQMRSSSAPTTYSWEVGLGLGQELEQLPDGDVAAVEPLDGPSFEGELPSEPFKEAESEAAQAPEDEGAGERAAEEELDSSLEAEGQLEKLPEAPQTTTPEIVAKAGELHPQDTAAEYAKAVGRMHADQEQTGATTIMVIQAPHVLDASGAEVPSSLAVAGDTVTLTVTPSETTTYPATAEVPVSAATNAAIASAPHRATFGLSDEEASAFDKSEEDGLPVEKLDPRLESGPLKARIARKIVAWNAWPKPGEPETPAQRSEHQELVQWLEAVKRAGLRPYITFRSCYTQSAECRTPTHEQYLRGVTAMMRALVNGGGNPKLPAVRLWGSWNEPKGKPSAAARKGPNWEKGEPKLLAREAAMLWGETERAAALAQCLRSCRVVAGEFEKYGPARKYIIEYAASIKNAERHHRFPTGVKPHIWGLHDYTDLERVRPERKNGSYVLRNGKQVLGGYRNAEAQGFIRTMTSRRFYRGAAFSMSEEGVLLQAQESPHTRLYENAELERLAAEDFLRLGSMKHVELANYYEYRAPADATREVEFDSALLSYHAGYSTSGPEAKEPEDWRQAYCVLALGENGCPPRRPEVSTGHALSTEASASAPASHLSFIPAVLVVVPEEFALAVNPEGSQTRVWFEYGPVSVSERATTPIEVGADRGFQSEAQVARLLRCEAGRYRAVAENAAGVSYGEEKTFQASCVYPT